MARKRFIWQIFPAFLLITLFSLLLVAYYVTKTVEDLHLRHTESDLISRARLLAPLASQYDPNGDINALRARCKVLGEDSATRITLILRDGRVIADSHELAEQMTDHANRPEIIEAYEGKVGSVVRFSHTLNTRMMYVAIPASAKADSLIVRVAIPVTAIGDTLHVVYARMLFIVLAVTTLAAMLSWFVSRRVMQPLAALKTGAERFAQGQLEQPLPIPESEEFARLTEALNLMARQLADHIQFVEQQRNEQQAILSSMVESVVAVDSNLRIITVNQAAISLLGVDPETIKGRPLIEAIRNTALHAFAQEVLKSQGVVETEFRFGTSESILLKAQGTVLRDSTHGSMGAVVVLNNVTRLHQLEAVRQDFVANVSHELKTPITSIKGFVETLLDDPNARPEDTRHFLQIIEKQANRLDAIIEDLLALSRLEDDNGHASLAVEPTPLTPIIDAAAELCQHQADLRGVRIQLECPEGLQVAASPALLEQGLVNLINNAIKYSEGGQTIIVHAHAQDGAIILDVIDEGVGIPANELERIFERFYRVDRARSRELGGTGLGLSIVKHIAHVHKGTVSVSSTLGEGSTFSLSLPIRSE
mgnify:CR=1 FL=1